MGTQNEDFELSREDFVFCVWSAKGSYLEGRMAACRISYNKLTMHLLFIVFIFLKAIPYRR